LSVIAKLNAKIGEAGSLKRRATTTAMFIAAGQGGRVALRLAGNLILTRLLVPEAFGLMALISAIQVGLIMLSDVGLGSAIVRSDNGDKPSFLRTAWTLRLIQFGLLSIIMILIGFGFLAAQTYNWVNFGDTVYGDPLLPWVMMVASFSLFLRALRPTTVDLANRNLQMGRVLLIEFIGGFVTFLSMVGLALVWPSVWALLLGSLMGAVTSTILLHLTLVGPRMWFAFEREYVKELWNFGIWMIPASAFGFLASRGDRFIIGALLDSTSFGIYAVAIIWISASGDLIQQILSRTGLGVLSEVGRKNPERLPKTFATVRMVQDVMAFAAGLFFLFFGTAFATAFYEGVFEGVAILLPILSLKLFLSRYEIFKSLIIKGGDSKSIAGISFVQAIATVTLIPAAMIMLEWPHSLIPVSLVFAAALPLTLKAAARQIPVSYVKEYLQLALIIGLFMLYYIFVLSV